MGIVISKLSDVSDIWPWLFVCRRANAFADRALDNATSLTWPLACRTTLRPSRKLTRNLLIRTTSAPDLPLHLALTFRQLTAAFHYSQAVFEVDNFMNDVLCLVDRLALTRATSLELNCTNCEYGLYNCMESLSSHAPNLQRLKITTTLEDEMGVWSNVSRTRMFGNVAPRLQLLTLDIPEVTTERISAFDAVTTLELSGRVFSLGEAREFLAGCASVSHLILRRAPALEEWSSALGHVLFRQRLAALQRLDVHISVEGDDVYKVIALIADPCLRPMESICVFVQSFSEHLLPTLLNTLPALRSTSGVHLFLQRDAAGGDSPLRIAVSPASAPDGHIRTRSIVVSKGSQAFCDAMELAGRTLLAVSKLPRALRRVEVPNGLLPWLLKLAGPGSTLPALEELRAVIDGSRLVNNTFSTRLNVPRLKAFTFAYGPEQEESIVKRQAAYESYVCSWVKFPDETRCPIEYLVV